MHISIKSLKNLEENDEGKFFSDSIGLAADWRRPGPVWEIPYSSLIPQKIEGLLTAGRCIGSTGDAWEITRVIPAAAMTGQAAGMAAALAVEKKTIPSKVDIVDLQRELRDSGFKLHIDELSK